jgi:excisionase family DNA binding protein
MMQEEAPLHTSVYASVDELARELGIGRQAAYAGLRDGSIPSIRLNGRGRFILPRAAIQEWLKTAGGRAGARS